MRNLLKLIVLVFFTMSVTARAAESDAPDALVRDTAQEVLNILKQNKDSGDRNKTISLVEEKVLPKFDFTRMTMLAVGKAWRSATPEQQQQLVKEFRTLLVRTYSSALESYKNQTITVKPLNAQPSDNEVTVKTVINQPGGQPIPIDYRMEKTGQGWKVFDVTIEGVSLVTNYRTSFASEVSRSGVDGLIKVLAEKNKKLDGAKKS